MLLDMVDARSVNVKNKHAVSSRGGNGEGGGEAKKRKQLHKSCRRHVGNEGDSGGKRKKGRQEKRVGLVATNPDKLENRQEAGGVAQGFRNKYQHWSPLQRINASGL